MHLVLCMAGIYRRFREAGYKTPKYLLPWRGRTILSHILATMTEDGAFSSVLLLANERDLSYRPDIEAVLAENGLAADCLHFVGDTRGQAETAALAVDCLETRGRLDTEDRVVFHNIDTILYGRDYRKVADILCECDGYIDVFESDGPQYSYVRIDQNGAVTEMAEKIVISNRATSGLYGFCSAIRFRDLAKSMTASGEFYISDVYRRMLSDGAHIRVNAPEPARDTLILGTPAEYEAALAEAEAG
ncbi:MAG: hypothetical protein U9N14_01535 [Pseudomonadota bacterium]|nr:hypothetical protein [Pseudomonadota bacterium]